MSSHNPSPRPGPPSSDTSFPIVAISILGIVTTSILLLSYYVFAVRCCFNCHRSDVVGRLSRSRRRLRDDRLMVYSTATENHGLGESEIQAIPTFRYRKGSDGVGKRSFHECAVCLNEFQEEERIRLLPNCFHVFHIDCIDTWLQTNANCPLCRSSITTTTPVPLDQFMASVPHQDPHQSGDTVIDIRDDGSEQAQGDTTTDAATNPQPWKSEQRAGHKRGRKLDSHGSMGDECIDVRGKDGQLRVQPMRRSFSMDSSTDRQLYMAVQKIMQQNPQFQEAAGGESSSTSGRERARRSLFSFHRHSRSAVLPVQIEQ